MNRLNLFYDRIYSLDDHYVNIPVAVRLPNDDALRNLQKREELSGPIFSYNFLDLFRLFLDIEEKALFERRQHLARWARKMHERYRLRWERVKAGNKAGSSRPA